MGQEHGIVGWLVGKMIHRSVKARFRNTYLKCHAAELPSQCIFVANHHGWYDGYLLFHLVKHLNRPSLDWIQEFASFPLFRYVGGLPFPLGDLATRVETMRETIRRMKTEGKSLMIFEAGVLHRGPEVGLVGEAIDLIGKKVPGVMIVPVAIRYDMSLHERPEAFLIVGDPIAPGASARDLATEAIREMLSTWEPDDADYRVLVPGTPDVNERWDRVRRR